MTAYRVVCITASLEFTVALIYLCIKKSILTSGNNMMCGFVELYRALYLFYIRWQMFCWICVCLLVCLLLVCCVSLVMNILFFRLMSEEQVSWGTFIPFQTSLDLYTLTKGHVMCCTPQWLSPEASFCSCEKMLLFITLHITPASLSADV